MAFRNFFNDYFYGKSGKSDFTESDLPANRLQLFWEVLKTRSGSMVGLNLLYLLCWIPAVAWTFLNLVQLQLVSAEGSDAGAAIHQLLFTYLVFLAPMIALTGPFNMGVSYVLRNWARDEHSFAFADFKSAMKENWKQGLGFGVIGGLVPLLVYICARVYLEMAASSPLFYLPLAITLMAALIWYLAADILPTMIVTYRQSLPGLIRNAVLLTLAALPRAIGVRLLTLVVPALTAACMFLFPQALSWVSAIATALYAIFMLAFNKLLCASHANALCETHLNPKIEGARTGIGLRPDHETEDTK